MGVCFGFDRFDAGLWTSSWGEIGWHAQKVARDRLVWGEASGLFWTEASESGRCGCSVMVLKQSGCCAGTKAAGMGGIGG